MIAEYVPNGHDKQSLTAEEPLTDDHDPATQDIHDVAPEIVEYEPRVHDWQFRLDVAAITVEKVPNPQF